MSQATASRSSGPEPIQLIAMLDENLPTFLNKVSSDNANANVIYFSQSGAEPTPEYILKQADPALETSRNRYALGLIDSSSQDIVYGEVLVVPEWSQPSLSAAELRAQNGRPNTPVPVTPDSFTVQLYNPDYQVAVRQLPGSWNSKDSWEFEITQQAFRIPTGSRVDREQDDPVASKLTPKIMFRWKRDSRLSKDMTCYLTGKSLGNRKSKEPDITVALFKNRRGGDTALTLYEPNMQRVEIEDRKGLDIVFLLSAEAIRDLYVSPNTNPFNVAASGPPASSSHPNEPGPGTRMNSKPSAPASGNVAMAGASVTAPAYSAAPPAALQNADPHSRRETDEETRRLRAGVEKEDKEADKREKAEQKRIKKMLEEEKKEIRKREAEVAKETERLKKLYGVEGQDYATKPPPRLPPRPGAQSHTLTVSSTMRQSIWPVGATPTTPPRPVSAGPAATSHQPQPQSQHNSVFPNCSILGSLTGHHRSGHGQPASNALSHIGAVIANAGSEVRDRKKMKKRSVHF